jgi:queuosine precursor transporter
MRADRIPAAEAMQHDPDAALRQGHSAFFVAIAVAFAACLIASNVIAVKIVPVAGVFVTAGVIVFPISYIIGDVLTEVYGFRAARRVIWFGFGANLLFVFAAALAIALPSAPFWKDEAAFEAVLGRAPRILAASFAAFLVGEFVNSYVLAKMKIATNGRWLWTRTIGSTLIGQLFDSAAFVFLAFGGVMDTPHVLSILAVQWLTKCGYEIVATPFTYAAVGYLKRKEGVDVYDRGTRFNPFALKG